MGLVLLGYPGTERTEYFLKAAEELGDEVRFVCGPSFAVDWDADGFGRADGSDGRAYVPGGQTYGSGGRTYGPGGQEDVWGIDEEGFDFSQLEGSVVKADPPLSSCYCVESLNAAVYSYLRFLRKLEQVPGIRLLNSCDAIENTLDKFTCKQKLLQAGLPVTPVLAVAGTTAAGAVVVTGAADAADAIATAGRGGAATAVAGGGAGAGAVAVTGAGAVAVTAAGAAATAGRGGAAAVVCTEGFAVAGAGDAVGAGACVEGFAGGLTFSRLRELMCEKKIYQVFIKPRFGSASAGVVAYRLNPRTGEGMIETSAAMKDGRLINTKRIRKTGDPAEISSIIGRVLSGGAIVELWIPKATHDGRAYDLRAVFQFGRLEYLLARQSRGPVTNLHLNNGALPIENLALPPALPARLEALCGKAVSQFPGLNVAGFDILLRKDGAPMIIEINGQGDLLFQDIFAENRIYKEQIKAMRRML